MRQSLIGERRQPRQTLWRQMQVRVLPSPKAFAGWQSCLPNMLCCCCIGYHAASRVPGKPGISLCCDCLDTDSHWGASCSVNALQSSAVVCALWTQVALL